MVDVWILVFSYFNLHTVYASGRTKFECQDGFYLSNVKSVFENEHRFYEFGCSPLSSHQVSGETCDISAISSSTSDDMHLSCNSSQQYIVGVSVINFDKDETWNLLCCQTPQIQIDFESCSLTSFVNEYRQSFTFQNGPKRLMTKWQSVYDKSQKDRRWWFQTCEFDNTIINLRDQLVPSDINELEKPNDPKNSNSPQSIQKTIEKLKSNDLFKSQFPSKFLTATPFKSTLKSNEDVYADYYDPDGTVRMQKSLEQKGDSSTNVLFKNLHKIFKTIEDGLTFFQWALQKNPVENQQSNKFDTDKGQV